jgi:protein gp37
MSKTKIEWCHLSINPIKGLCPVACSYCYARRMYKRFKWDETIRFDDQVLFNLPKEPKRIFVGSTMELFGKWVKDNWLEFIFQTVTLYPQHTFIFLTKHPENLMRYSPFPQNCWIGCSVTNQKQYMSAIVGLCAIEANIKFISFEPLLEEVITSHAYSFEDTINWAIIGQQTPPNVKTTPALSWLMNIVREADIYELPVFLKDNLLPMLTKWSETNSCQKAETMVLNTLYDGDKLRQELPK